MKNILLLLLLSFNSLCFGQLKTVKFISSNNLDDNDLSILKEIRSSLIGKNNKGIKNFKFKYESCYNIDQINLDKIESFGLIETNSKNLKYQTLQDQIKYLNTISDINKSIELEVSTELELNISNSTNEISKIIKFIKKSKQNNIIVILNNGYKPYNFSAENINLEISKKQNTNAIEALRPIIITPKFNALLRPDESSMYYIEFDSVGIFPAYELTIYWKKPINEIYDKTIYDSLILLQECISFSAIEDFKSRKSTTDFALFAVTDSRCKIAINEHFLADICYKLDPAFNNTEEAPDPDCRECKNECLYLKKFSITLKGCAPGVIKERIPHGNTPIFLFQCPKDNFNH